MTIPPRNPKRNDERLGLPHDYEDERQPFGVERVVDRFRDATIEDFDPDARVGVPNAESPEEVVERLARTPARAEATTEAPTMEVARLDDHDGLGMLRVQRDASGVAIRANGTWRSRDGRLDLSDEMPVGSTHQYKGMLHDEAADDGPISVAVTVTGHGDYRDTEGLPLRLVRFVAPEAVEAADRPLIRSG